MKTVQITKVRLPYLLAGVFIVLFVWWFLSPSRISPSKEWQPKTRFLFNQKLEKVNSYLEGEKIPKIIHQTWKDTDIPEMTVPWVTRCLQLHPDWEYWFWTDADIRTLISDLYPHSLALFDNYPGGGFRADAFRYFVLYEYGGVYLDIDMECLKPLDDYVERENCFLTQEPLEHAHFLASMGIPLVSNAAMGCRRGHAFFEHVITDPITAGFAGMTYFVLRVPIC